MTLIVVLLEVYVSNLLTVAEETLTTACGLSPSTGKQPKQRDHNKRAWLLLHWKALRDL